MNNGVEREHEVKIVSSRREVRTEHARKLPVSALLVADSPRLNGEDCEHVQVLAAVEEPLPPILVHHPSMRVIDGMHRLRAAILNGQTVIEAEFFEGSEEDAFVAAVKANMAHGLPLTLADREAAAARILDFYPQRSDRWIASTTGLAASTVASIRRQVWPGDWQAPARTGRDGRVRPLNSAHGRQIASDVITRNPQASLREVAQVAGISPATVRDVKERLRRGDDPVPASGRRGRRAALGEDAPEPPRTGRQPEPARDRASLLRDLRKDPSLRYTESGRALLAWLNSHATGPGAWHNLIDSTPPHCAYLIAQLARCCAEEWQEVAGQLEDRLRNMA